MKFDIIANVAVTIVARPSLFGSALCFSYIEQQGKRVIYDEIEASAIAKIRVLTKREVVQWQGKGVYAVRIAGIGP